MDMDDSYGAMDLITKDSGRILKNMDKVTKCSRMELSRKEDGRTTSSME